MLTEPDLARLALFEGVPTRDLAELLVLAPPVLFPAGAPLFGQGEPAQVAFLVAEGILEVSAESSGRTRRLGTVQEGEVVGELALFGPGQVRSATVRAVVDSTCMMLSEQVMVRGSLNLAILAIELELLQVMTTRMRRTNLTIQGLWKELEDAPERGWDPR